MDFLDPNKKRSNRIKLFLGYALVGIAIATGSLVLLFAALGYSIDKSGRVIQQGLVFLSSQPEGATVYLEGIHNNFKKVDKTNSRQVVKEGEYKATLIKEGYRSWQRFFSVEGGGVVRMVYPFLFPEKLETDTQKAYEQEPGFVTASPDRHWIVVQQPGSFTNFDVLDANDPKKEAVSITLPDGVMTAATASQSLEVVEWSTDNANILCKHVHDGIAEFVIINRDKPAESFNVNTVTGQNPYDVVLKDKKIEQLYLHMAPDGLLQTVDVKTKVLTPLVARTFAFKPHGTDMLVYVTPHESKPDVVSVKIRSEDKDYELRELPAGTNYVVDVARFDNSWYVVAGAESDNKVYVYKDPLETLINPNSRREIIARTLRIEKPKEVSFSANARFVAAQSGQKFAVYDAETDRQYRYEISDKFDTERAAKWMDGHRLTSVSNGEIVVFDFDGINLQHLMRSSARTNVMFDRDYIYSYALEAAQDKPGGYNLTRTLMLVGN